MFDDQNLVKSPSDQKQSKELLNARNEQKEAILKINFEKTGKQETPEFLDRAKKTFAFWQLGTI